MQVSLFDNLLDIGIEFSRQKGSQDLSRLVSEQKYIENESSRDFQESRSVRAIAFKIDLASEISGYIVNRGSQKMRHECMHDVFLLQMLLVGSSNLSLMVRARSLHLSSQHTFFSPFIICFKKYTSTSFTLGR